MSAEEAVEDMEGSEIISTFTSSSSSALALSLDDIACEVGGYPAYPPARGGRESSCILLRDSLTIQDEPADSSSTGGRRAGEGRREVERGGSGARKGVKEMVKNQRWRCGLVEERSWLRGRMITRTRKRKEEE
mmetsp:Transcript_15879/g.53126  ORF Transcript_15879/g.53126 Transcript_15879/m.53126 type:complete len:133 (+) Transcript_15879:1786-2184(+)